MLWFSPVVYKGRKEKKQSSVEAHLVASVVDGSQSGGTCGWQMVELDPENGQLRGHHSAGAAKADALTNLKCPTVNSLLVRTRENFCSRRLRQE